MYYVFFFCGVVEKKSGKAQSARTRRTPTNVMSWTYAVSLLVRPRVSALHPKFALTTAQGAALSFSRLGADPLDDRPLMDDVWVSRNGPLTYVTCSGYPHEGGPLLSVPCVIYRYIEGALSIVGHRARSGVWEYAQSRPIEYTALGEHASSSS